MLAFICPKCRQRLTQQAKSWTCVNSHCFDVAKEGYVNLLLVQQKRSRQPGDNAEMIHARRAFLESGYYQGLRDALIDIVSPLQAADWLDIGCGEGYYTDALHTIIPDVAGMDIAKSAVKLAARRSPTLTWLVGSAAALPLADDSVDGVSSLFSPLPFAEIARVLRPEKHLLFVTPSPRHLWTVREALFGEVQAHRPEKFLEAAAPWFEMTLQKEVSYPLALTQQALRQLLAMTPYAWRAKSSRREVLEAQSGFQTEASFSITLLAKRPATSSAKSILLDAEQIVT